MLLSDSMLALCTSGLRKCLVLIFEPVVCKLRANTGSDFRQADQLQALAEMSRENDS